MALEDEGFHVMEAADGSQCLERVKESPPDIVLLDLMLPDRDGFSVCRAIRRGSDVPVIMVTARTDSHDVVAGLESGADDYVTKPLVAKELAARIRANPKISMTLEKAAGMFLIAFGIKLALSR